MADEGRWGREPDRFSARRKTEAILGVLRGEPTRRLGARALGDGGHASPLPRAILHRRLGGQAPAVGIYDRRRHLSSLIVLWKQGLSAIFPCRVLLFRLAAGSSPRQDGKTQCVELVHRACGSLRCVRGRQCFHFGIS